MGDGCVPTIHVYQKKQLAGAVGVYSDITSALFFVTVLVMLSFILSPLAFSPLQNGRNYDGLARPQFRLLDIAILVVQVQLLAVLLMSAERDPDAQAVALTWFGVPLGLWWFGGVRMLTCAKINHLWYRVFFLSVVAPLGYLVALSLSSTILLLMFAVYAVCAAVVLHDFSAFVSVILFAFAVSVAFAILFLVRTTCRMLIASTEMAET